MKRAVRIVFVLAVLAGAAVLVWWLTRPREAPRELALYGNVDLRQIQLAFNNSERIVAVDAQEGDRPYPGQILARLDTSRLQPQVTQAEAQTEAQRQIVNRLRAGSRPEEIAQARANVNLAQAERENPNLRFERFRRLIRTRAVSQEEYDAAQATLETAEARLRFNQ